MFSFKLAIVTENGSKQKRKTNMQILRLMWSWRWDSFPSSIQNHKDFRKGLIYFLISDDDNKLLLWYGWPTKGVKPYFQSEPLPEILTIGNFWPAASRVEPAQNLSSGLVEWNCVIVITTTPRRYSTISTGSINLTFGNKLEKLKLLFVSGSWGSLNACVKLVLEVYKKRE